MAVYQLSPWKRSDRLQTGNDDFASLRGLQREVDSIFDNFFRGFNFDPVQKGQGESFFAPQLDVSETEKSYHLSVELPGVEEKDIDVSLSNNVLTIKGEKKFEAENKDKNYHRVERSYGSFQRSLTLPDGIEEDKIRATFRNGVLEIEVPKPAESKPSVRKIDVKAK